MAEVGELETVLGYRFLSPGILEQALTHGSVRHEQQAGDSPQAHPATPDNERLEFLGDAVVGMLVAELLYRRYPELDEGELTRLRAALVSRKHLGLVGAALDLGHYLRLGKAEERNGGRKKTVLLANCVEALIAALYLEGGLAAASAFVRRAVTDPYLDQLRLEMQENRAIGDYKTALQELLQGRHARQPEYLLQAESGPDHRKRFIVEVRVEAGRAIGEGSTKKRAEQEAARELYERLAGRAGNGLVLPGTGTERDAEQMRDTAQGGISVLTLAAARPLPDTDSSKNKRVGSSRSVPGAAAAFEKAAGAGALPLRIPRRTKVAGEAAESVESIESIKKEPI